MRLIDADKVEIRAEFGCNCDGLLLIPYRDAKKAIDDAPTVDAVQVVRCRDCQKCYYDEARKSYVMKPGCPMNPMGYARIDPDGYCYRGERRECSQ